MNDETTNEQLITVPRSKELPDSVAETINQKFDEANDGQDPPLWFNVIPVDLQKYFTDHLVNDNYEAFEKKFTYQQFKERMAQNWVERYYYFRHLVEEQGLQEVFSFGPNDERSVVILTQSASVVQAQSPDKRGKRTMEYSKIKFRPRTAESISNQPFEDAFASLITIGNSVPLASDPTNKYFSPPIAIFTAPKDADLAGLSQTMTTGFTKINERTLAE